MVDPSQFSSLPSFYYLPFPGFTGWKGKKTMPFDP